MFRRNKIARTYIMTLISAPLYTENFFLWTVPGSNPVILSASGTMMPNMKHSAEMSIRIVNRRTLHYDILVRPHAEDPEGTENRLWSGTIGLPMTEEEAREDAKKLRREVDTVLRPWRYEKA